MTQIWVINLHISQNTRSSYSDILLSSAVYFHNRQSETSIVTISHIRGIQVNMMGVNINVEFFEFLNGIAIKTYIAIISIVVRTKELLVDNCYLL